MSVNSLEWLDIWRLVTARRCISGQIELVKFQRLGDLLADNQGQCRYALEFGLDAVQPVAWVELRIEAALPLVCQRSLQRFLLPVVQTQRLGLVRNEAEEVALPDRYEPLWVPSDGRVSVSDLVEDELILTIPVVPVAPDSQMLIKPPEPDSDASEVPAATARPFAVLAALKKA